jgi:U3 small nucleolar RNA-associated protein 19
MPPILADHAPLPDHTTVPPQPEALAAKYRGQFFQLVDIFLASGLVPAYTVAAFAKRFARLALSSSPAGAMLSLAFVHNLIRRHPSLMVLMHKPLSAQQQEQHQQQLERLAAAQQQQEQQEEGDAGAADAGAAAPAAPAVAAAADKAANGHAANGHAGHSSSSSSSSSSSDEESSSDDEAPQQRGRANGNGTQAQQAQQRGKQRQQQQAQQEALLGSDPFDPSEEDPVKSRAVESSLWELTALKEHYSPQVSYSLGAAGASVCQQQSRTVGLLVAAA